ncbi:hypothetical protein [Sphingomonas sp.]|uniref:hypothetical protein n=1 Tax=Sphingomonas sp. TaxID=28214 RepID=UPI00286EAC19|nr:hypothetical protein [Sphingomonas sp.]
MADVKRRDMLRRLATREYAPWVGTLLCWLIITLTVGTADAARLLAAGLFVRSLRYLVAPNSNPSLARRTTAPRAILRQAMATALKLEGAALLVGALLLALLVSSFEAMGLTKTAWLCLLVAAGLPARFLYPLVGGRRHFVIARSALTWGGAGLAALAWLSGAGLVGMALALGLREWIALGASLWLARRNPDKPAYAQKLHWHEIGGYSYRTARRRFAYRLGKGILTAVLGPVGGFAARTGRGVGLVARIERFAPTSLPLLVLLCAGGTAASLALLAWLPEPSLHIVAATLFRIAVASGSILLWWRFRDVPVGRDDEDEEDD